MDWLVFRIRAWLGIEIDNVAILARLNKQSDITTRLIDRLDAAFDSVHTLAKEDTSLYKQFAELQSKLVEETRIRQALILAQESQIADLRRILTARPAVPAAIKTRSWTEARRLMGDEVLNDA